MSALARTAARREAARPDISLADLRAFAYTIPTDLPEADGTFAWDATTLVVVEVHGGGETGLGYSYTSEAAVPLIKGALWRAIRSCDANDPPAAWRAMHIAVRNLGRDGITASTISAVDTALWDLKARLLDRPLALVFGRYRETVPIYGSGGFTTYTDEQLCDQLAGWIERDGCAWVKMKIGTHPDSDFERVRLAKRAIGERALLVDANGAYRTKQALEFAEIFSREANVRWFEEPVSSDDLVGLACIRGRAPAGMEIAAGEYGYDTDYFRTMLSSGAVDVLQADVTRCGGYTGFLQVAALCEAHHVDLSGHCAPALHLPAACAAPRLRHLEWFHDHVRIEHMLFDGSPRPKHGTIEPDLSRPGHGLTFKFKDAERFRVA
jgi:L-alanine-DL-glutamate epimerase-like enolase superfamily enzyme